MRWLERMGQCCAARHDEGELSLYSMRFTERCRTGAKVSPLHFLPHSYCTRPKKKLHFQPVCVAGRTKEEWPLNVEIKRRTNKL